MLKDVCISSLCYEGVSCEIFLINGDFICFCKKGWIGNDCFMDVNECYESEYCFFFI